MENVEIEKQNKGYILYNGDIYLRYEKVKETDENEMEKVIQKDKVGYVHCTVGWVNMYQKF